jgi:hypothetical protein
MNRQSIGNCEERRSEEGLRMMVWAIGGDVVVMNLKEIGVDMIERKSDGRWIKDEMSMDPRV